MASWCTPDGAGEALCAAVGAFVTADVSDMEEGLVARRQQWLSHGGSGTPEGDEPELRRNLGMFARAVNDIILAGAATHGADEEELAIPGSSRRYVKHVEHVARALTRGTYAEYMRILIASVTHAVSRLGPDDPAGNDAAAPVIESLGAVMHGVVEGRVRTRWDRSLVVGAAGRIGYATAVAG